MKRLFVILWLALSLVGCVTSHTLRYPPVRWLDDTDRISIDEPRTRKASKAWDIVNHQVIFQIERLLDLPERGRGFADAVISGSGVEALNVNNFDEVADSSWFTNRMGRRHLSISELKNGPNTNSGPQAPWRVISAKVEGRQPGMLIKDAAGETYLLKFDPKNHLEMATGAEIISTKFFHAFGYNVPQNSIVRLDPAIFKLTPQSYWLDHKDRKRPFNVLRLKRFLNKLPAYPNGQYRVLASKFLEGKPLGPFIFRSVKRSDPNDRIPHQHRRELRGYRLFSALLQHVDSRSANTLNMFLKTGPDQRYEPQGKPWTQDSAASNGVSNQAVLSPEPTSEGDGKGHIKHYLLDFGSTLGSAGYKSKSRTHLYDYRFNIYRVLASLGTLGLYRPYWEKAGSPDLPAVGFFESQLFRPEKWKPTYPNPAFQNMTDRDAFWAAKIIAPLTDEEIAAIVDEAQYSDPRARDYILATLIDRRNKIGRVWFERLNPLDDFQMTDRGTIVFNDLAVRSGMAPASGNSYRYRLHSTNQKRRLADWQSVASPEIIFTAEMLRVLNTGDRMALEVRTLRPGKKFLSPSIDVIIQKDGAVKILGLQRKYY